MENKEYFFEIINGRKCPKCNSHSIGQRFTHVEDTEDYNLHYDTLKCHDCGYWDFPDAFHTTKMDSDHSEICPKCGAVGKVMLSYYDYYSGDIELICNECKHEAPIEKFVGEERWNSFVEARKKRIDKEIEAEVDFLMKYGDW